MTARTFGVDPEALENRDKAAARETTRRASLPILVGEANPYGGDPFFALYPDPPNSAGGRLCRAIMRLSADVYLRRFDRRNLCRQRWSAPEARETAAAIGLEVSEQFRHTGHPRTVVLLGSKVCAAFGAPYETFTVRAQADCRLVVLPHPSGLCRAWNEPRAFDRAREVLRSAGVLP